MNATITRDLGGNRFEVRADANRLFTVRAKAGEPRRLRVGDSVLLEGYINNRNVFVAESISRISGGTGGGTGIGNIDFYGTVVTMASSTRVTVRADDGRNFTVNSRNRLARAISRGDRVRVTGVNNNGNNVRSASVTLVTNAGTTTNSAFRIDGTATSTSDRGRPFALRGADGRAYTVRPNNSSSFNRGDRLRILGRLSNGTIYATSITRL
jgi:translation initiation factor IF-1